MGIRTALTASLTAIAAACSLTALSAQADVFHGYWIGGKIEQTYHRLGGWNRFGDATTPERVSAWNGRFQVFARDASIYWHPNVDNGTAHQVGGRIRDKWADLGWENAALGYPVTDELTPPDKKGRFNHFQGGSIYWSPDTDAHQVWGDIRDKWAAQGWETGPLGYPVTDERTTPDGKGKYNYFQGGSIYSSAAGGTRPITGKILNYWADSGWEKSRFSFPSSDAYTAAGGTKQDFIGGSIQSFEPTGVALPQYDNKQYSSYRQVYPLFAKEDKTRWHAAGAHRELIQHMDTYFPLTGCPKELTTGAVCTFTGMGARPGTVTVERISDNGFTLKTAADHPEGGGRLLNIRFDEVTAPPASEKNVVFDSPDVKAQYTGSNKTWIRLVVESFGPTQTTQVQGPFSSEHVANQVWAPFATTLRTTLDQSTTSYVPLAR